MFRIRRGPFPRALDFLGEGGSCVSRATTKIIQYLVLSFGGGEFLSQASVARAALLGHSFTVLSALSRHRYSLICLYFSSFISSPKSVPFSTLPRPDIGCLSELVSPVMLHHFPRISTFFLSNTASFKFFKVSPRRESIDHNLTDFRYHDERNGGRLLRMLRRDGLA